MFDEIETAAPNTFAVEIGDRVFIEGFIDIRNTAIGTATLRNSVDDGHIVNAVTARIYDHRTGQSKGFLQCFEFVEARIWWCIGAIGRVWIFVCGSEDMTMGIGRIGRKFEFRGFCVGIWCPARFVMLTSVNSRDEKIYVPLKPG